MLFIEWIRKNKFPSLLIVVLLLIIAKVYFLREPFLFPPSSPLLMQKYGPSEATVDFNVGMGAPVGIGGEAFRQVAPVTRVSDRMVQENSYMSLLVKNVNGVIEEIKRKTVEFGGFMVESSLTSPEESPVGYITLRVPSGKLDEALSYFRSLSVKVVSESILGNDVTDIFVDNEARLAILNQNLSRLKEIMSKAEKVQDILQVQNEIFNLQSQVESIVGQQNYLKKTSETAKITVNLSTDELALPYAPAKGWRPTVVFKLAVRSLIETIQGAGTGLIWVTVFSPIWLIAVVVVFFLRSRLIKKV